MNLSLLLRSLSVGGPRSRARLAADTGLTKATVSSLVAELTERGLVAEGAPDRGGVGRPGRVVQLDRTRLRSVGIELNVDYVAGLATDLTGAVVARHRVSAPLVELGPAAGLGTVADVARALLAQCAARPDQVETLTLSMPGMMELDGGVLAYAPNLGWRQVDVLRTLTTRLRWPRTRMHVDNDANLGARAEFAVGRAAGTANLLYLVGEIGVGAGMIAGARLQRGAAGFAGEVGHIPIGPPRSLCGCGRRGCWETAVGMGPLLALLPEAERAGAAPDRSSGRDLRLAALVARAEAGDARVLSALTGMGRWLGTGAAVLANVLDPEVIVLGGHFAVLRRFLGPEVRRFFDRGVLPDPATCRVEFSDLGYEAPALGAAHDGLNQIMADPGLVEPLADATPA